MKKHPASMSQRRVLRLVNHPSANADLSYSDAAQVLTAAGYACDGLGPMTWRQAFMLSDQELLNTIKMTNDDGIESLQEAYGG